MSGVTNNWYSNDRYHNEGDRDVDDAANVIAFSNNKLNFSTVLAIVVTSNLKAVVLRMVLKVTIRQTALSKMVLKKL